MNNDVITVLIDKTEVDTYTKEAKAVSINMATKKIVSTISYTQYVATHKNPVVYTCPVMGDPCTLTINNKKVSSKNTSLYSSRYFTTVINTTLL